MGADGGMCWIKLRNATKYNRVHELMKPFWFLTNVDDYHESNIDWHDPNIQAPEYLVGSYGTDQEFDIYNDLVEVLECDFDEEFDPNQDPVVKYGHLTFFELIEDLKIRPFVDHNFGPWFYLTDGKYFPYGMRNVSDSNGRYVSKLEEMLWCIVQYSSDEELREDLGILADMKVNDWLDELRSLLESDNHGSEETWT